MAEPLAGLFQALVEGLDGGPLGEFSVAEYVGAKATTVDQRSKCTPGGEALQVRAGLTESLTEAFDVSDPEASSHEGVEVDSPGDDVASRGGVVEVAAVGQG
jgi:hypothetical protein